MNKLIKLKSGSIVSITNDRVRVDLPKAPSSCVWNSMSSATLNGGNRIFPTNGGISTNDAIHVINYKVPHTYNGYDPAPQELISDITTREGIPSEKTVGLLTAASMKTCVSTSRCIQGVIVEVVVTVGLSNSRMAGAEADFFGLLSENDRDLNKKCSNAGTDSCSYGKDQSSQHVAKIRPGTINTIIITNTPLSSSALIETYAIAIEAKCRACSDHGVRCAKDDMSIAQGTGTDCCVLITPTISTQSNDDKDGDKRKYFIEHAGKHCLFAEMVGQTVHESTSEAIMINIRNMHGSYHRYKLKTSLKAIIAILKGSRPCIPPRPMMPVPGAPLPIIFMGIFTVLLIYVAPLQENTSVLLAAVAWDRYLAEPPVMVHPVVIAGNCISAILARMPDRVFQNAVLGFGFGVLFMVFMLTTFVFGGRLFLESVDFLSLWGSHHVRSMSFGYFNIMLLEAANLTTWVMKVVFVKSTFSIQLLCTIALQMAKFLEREQIDEARMQLSWLCSRDPSKLKSSELAAGTLESLSENLSDGFVAPLFWYVVLGPLGAFGYRIANTLDSRVGYRGKFEWFGKPSARFDDMINLIPARLTALLLLVAACCVKGTRPMNGFIAAWNESSKCESPNAGWPMACFSGVLGVRLEKPGAYCLGRERNKPCPKDIRVGYLVAQFAGGFALIFAVIFLHYRG